MSKAVSRVMSWMIIYLDISLPICSSNLPESWRATICFLLGLASNGVYICPSCYQKGGSLLHCPSTLTRFWSSQNRRYISVALSLESPPPDVIRHSALWSPDFPHLRPFGNSSCDHLLYSQLIKIAY